MTIFGTGARAAMLAGALAFAGPVAAGDEHGKTQTSSKSGEASEGMKPGSASGLGTTGQQERSSTSSSASGQSDSTETSGTSSGTPHARSGSDTSDMSSAQASNELTGRVEKFDHESKKFTVAGKDLKVDSSTEVMKDGKKAELTDIQEGDEIRASYSGSGDALTAQHIEVTSKSDASSTGGTSTSSGTNTSTGTTDVPAGRGGPMGPGTGAGQGDSAGTTTGTGTDSTPSSGAQPGGNK